MNYYLSTIYQIIVLKGGKNISFSIDKSIKKVYSIQLKNKNLGTEILNIIKEIIIIYNDRIKKLYNYFKFSFTFQFHPIYIS